MKLTFLGAAGTVTGSRFLLETADKTILVDCGLYQEWDLSARNWDRFLFNPSKIDAVLLTHAHLDHCGYLPKLVREGFRGKIYCTAPTAAMAKVSLLDSANVQEADANAKRRRHQKEGRRGPYPEEPLYRTEDVEKVFGHFHHVQIERAFNIGRDVEVAFFDAGHILGAAMIQLDLRCSGQTRRIVFSGDIGRWNRPILKDPHVFDRADYVIMEGTYGDRIHEDDSRCMEQLADVINRTRKQGGHVVIPTFAIGRTQELLYCLNQLLNEKKIPALPVFVDSPMAMEITDIFKGYPQFFDSDAREILKYDLELFDFPSLKFTPKPQESKAINHLKETAVIMAGGGMCTGGRIKHHLALNVERPESTILFVGYQAKGTLGRAILEKPQQVRIFGRQLELKASVEKINGFSAHADQGELIRWVGAFKHAPREVFIVHAEDQAAQALKKELGSRMSTPVTIASYQQEVVLS